MGKFSGAEEHLLSVFATAQWKAEDIPTYPANYVGKIDRDYVRVQVIASGQGANRISCSGVLLVDIFVKAGEGTRQLSQIADKLDLFLQNKLLKTTGLGRTQTFTSVLQPRGLDPDNSGFYRGLYSLPFQFSEVTQ